MKDKSQSPASPLTGLLADARQLVEAGGFSTVGAASVVKILQTALSAIDDAALRMADQDTQGASEEVSASAWITQPDVQDFSEAAAPMGVGWKLGKNGAFWMLRNASLIVPGWLKAGTKITLSGPDATAAKAVRALSLTVGTTPTRALKTSDKLSRFARQKAWQKTFILDHHHKTAAPYSLLYLSTKGRDVTADLKSPGSEGGMLSAAASLCLQSLVLHPPA